MGRKKKRNSKIKQTVPTCQLPAESLPLVSNFLLFQMPVENGILCLKVLELLVQVHGSPTSGKSSFSHDECVKYYYCKYKTSTLCRFSLLVQIWWATHQSLAPKDYTCLILQNRALYVVSLVIPHLIKFIYCWHLNILFKSEGDKTIHFGSIMLKFGCSDFMPRQRTFDKLLYPIDTFIFPCKRKYIYIYI
jgi:hypothetical protein